MTSNPVAWFCHMLRAWQFLFHSQPKTYSCWEKTLSGEIRVRKCSNAESTEAGIEDLLQGSFREFPVIKWTVIHDNSITSFKENRTIPPRYFHSFLKENQEFVAIWSASTIFTKSTPREECKRYIVKVVLDADLWSIRQESRLWIVCSVFVTLASHKKWILLTAKSLTWSRKKPPQGPLSLLF